MFFLQERIGIDGRLFCPSKLCTYVAKMSKRLSSEALRRKQGGLAGSIGQAAEGNKIRTGTRSKVYLQR